MPDHVCEYKSTIGRLDKELFGNGNKGLVKEFTEHKTKFEDMEDHLEKLATSYSALAKSRLEQDINDKQRIEMKKQRNTVIQKLGVIFAIVFGAVSTLYLVLEAVGLLS